MQAEDYAAGERAGPGFDLEAELAALEAETQVSDGPCLRKLAIVVERIPEGIAPSCLQGRGTSGKSWLGAIFNAAAIVQEGGGE